MTHLAILADDLTGAADAAGAFATAGFATAIVFQDGQASPFDVIARSTDTRDLDASTAIARTDRESRLLAQQPQVQPGLFYIKIDSALRGHPCPQLTTVMHTLGGVRALVAPALPAEGRTTVGAHQFINGVPLERTSLGATRGTSDLVEIFGCEPTLPISHLDLPTVRAGAQRLSRAISSADAGIVIADGETDADLQVVAEAALESGIKVLAGSAGLARQLAPFLPPPERTADGTSPIHGGEAVLVVAASQHPATVEQVDALRGVGIPTVALPQTMLDGIEASVGSIVDQISMHLASKQSVALTTAGSAPSRLGSAFVAATVTNIVAQVVRRQAIDGLVLTGGDVAAAVLHHLGASVMILRGEVLPAVPWGVIRGDLLDNVPIITKAGSFGERDALLQCLNQLQLWCAG